MNEDRKRALRDAFERGREEFREDLANPYAGTDDELAERYREGRRAELEAIYE